MLCEKCLKNEATTHVKNLINGEYSEYMLCDECSKNLGFSSLLSDINNEFSSFVDTMFSNALPARSGATRCKKCGSTYNDILSSRKLGCSSCFDLYKDEIKDSILSIHGDVTHVGKVPKNYYKKLENKKKVEKLKEELSLAVEKEEYEKAATLRDKIKEIEEG